MEIRNDMNPLLSIGTSTADNVNILVSPRARTQRRVVRPQSAAQPRRSICQSNIHDKTLSLSPVSIVLRVTEGAKSHKFTMETSKNSTDLSTIENLDE